MSFSFTSLIAEEMLSHKARLKKAVVIGENMERDLYGEIPDESGYLCTVWLEGEYDDGDPIKRLWLLNEWGKIVAHNGHVLAEARKLVRDDPFTLQRLFFVPGNSVPNVGHFFESLERYVSSLQETGPLNGLYLRDLTTEPPQQRLIARLEQAWKGRIAESAAARQYDRIQMLTERCRYDVIGDCISDIDAIKYATDIIKRLASKPPAEHDMYFRFDDCTAVAAEIDGELSVFFGENRQVLQNYITAATSRSVVVDGQHRHRKPE